MKLTGRIADQGLTAFKEKFKLWHGRRAPRIWILVADEGVAKIFRKDDGHLESIGEARPEELTVIELSNRSMGRMASAAGSTVQHKFEPHMAASRQEELSFVRDLAEWLDAAESMDVFDRLILVASPRTLGELRSVISNPVQGRIAAEIDKDLTKLSTFDLRKALDDILWF